MEPWFTVVRLSRLAGCRIDIGEGAKGTGLALEKSPVCSPAKWRGVQGTAGKETTPMKNINAVGMLLLSMVIAISPASLGVAGEQRSAPVKQYQGQIRSIRIDTCGLQPGTCEGSLVVAQSGGREVTLAVKSGTWIKRGEQLVLIEELGVGNYVQVQAAEIAGAERATNVDVRTTP
jgi:hypothetical protein